MIGQPGKYLGLGRVSEKISCKGSHNANTCKLAISFLSSFCPATSPPLAPAAVATAEAAKNAGVPADSRAQPDADDGVSPPECLGTGTTPENDGNGLA